VELFCSALRGSVSMSALVVAPAPVSNLVDDSNRRSHVDARGHPINIACNLRRGFDRLARRYLKCRFTPPSKQDPAASYLRSYLRRTARTRTYSSPTRNWTLLSRAGAITSLTFQRRSLIRDAHRLLVLNAEHYCSPRPRLASYLFRHKAISIRYRPFPGSVVHPITAQMHPASPDTSPAPSKTP